MAYTHDYRENLADGFIKDLNLENMQLLLQQCKADAAAWCPQFSFADSVNGESIVFKIILGEGNTLHGVAYNLSKHELEYLDQGNILVETIAEALTSIYTTQLKTLIADRIKNLPANLRLQKGTSK